MGICQNVDRFGCIFKTLRWRVSVGLCLNTYFFIYSLEQPINSHPVDLKEDDTKSKDDTSKAHKRKTKKHNRHEECTESNEILSVKVKVEKASPQKVKIKEEKMSPPVQVKEELETPKKKRKKSK